MFVNSPKTFDEAKDSCQKKDQAELISINSEFEQGMWPYIKSIYFFTKWPS